jgi:hypothetical protein
VPPDVEPRCPLDRGIPGPGPSLRLQLPAPHLLSTRRSPTCPGRGQGWSQGPVLPPSSAPRSPRGAVRRRLVLKAASLHRGQGRGQSLRAAAARRQRHPPGWPRCPWWASGRVGSGSHCARAGGSRVVLTLLAPPPSPSSAPAAVCCCACASRELRSCTCPTPSTPSPPPLCPSARTVSPAREDS